MLKKEEKVAELKMNLTYLTFGITEKTQLPFINDAAACVDKKIYRSMGKTKMLTISN